MSDSEPPATPPLPERMAAAFSRAGRAVGELAETFAPVAQALARLARDPRVQAAIAADREVGQPGCHCRCAAVHRRDPGICESRPASTVRIDGMDVPMCAPCQAARAAAKLSRQA